MPGDVAQLEQHRMALTGLCYRMMGSNGDADDAVQETMVRAWRGLDRFDERSSLRTWLYRIASNVCLDALSDRTRRARPLEEGPSGRVDDTLEQRPATHWLEPIADARVIPADCDPAERLALRQSVRLAFVSAVQHLPPKQRAALLLSDVLGCSAVEVAECLDTTTASINSALQRARATLAEKKAVAAPSPPTPAQSDLVDRYVAAFESYDVEALTALLRDDAVLSMPPFTLWLRGPEAIAAWMSGRGSGCRGSRVIRTEASGAPAFAQYRPSPEGGHRAWALVVLEPADDGMAAIHSFLDVDTLFPRCGLPLVLPPS